MTQKKVAIVGAGLAGLVTLKSCLEEKVDVTAFEQETHIGGNWKFKEKGISIFRNTELTSSKYLTAFSDFPMPEEYPHFLKHTQYLDYLQAYAQHFDLNRHIKFGTSVKSIQRQGDQWSLEVAPSEAGNRLVFDAIAVCTGLNTAWELPALTNKSDFKGKIIHSSAYKDSRPYHDQNVVVIGGGESGGDLVYELSQVASEVTLSLRRGVFVMPKLDKQMTLPGDYFHLRSTYHLPPIIYERLEGLVQNLFTFVNRKQASWQIRHILIRLSGGRYHQQIITKSDTLTQSLTRANVHLKPGIQRFTTDGVVFDDGTTTQADTIIFCSGFKISFPFLPIDSQGWDWRHLYKKIFHPDLPNIGFVGFARPHIGAMPPITELQARYFAGIVSDRLRLPDPDQMRTIIDADAQRTTQTKPLVVERVTGIVSFVPYLYELAELIGCQPVLSQLVKQPAVLWSVLFGTVAGPHFRLCGPHSDPLAGRVIAKEGLHLTNLKTMKEIVLFLLFQIIWGGGAMLGYPLFKMLSYIPGWETLEPELKL
ncbi:MAG: NAD(P)-binding domain-containing protein [Cyanobacteria bacterium J06635_1]